MTSINPTRFTQALLLAAIVAALAVPGAALGDSTPTRSGTDAVATTQPWTGSAVHRATRTGSSPARSR